MHRQRAFATLLVLAGLFLTLCVGRLPVQFAADRQSSSSSQASGGSRPEVPADLFVDDDNAGTQDGSAAHPYRTVQQAIDAATDNAVIAVAGGTYPQNIRVQDKAVRLYGGYVG